MWKSHREDSVPMVPVTVTSQTWQVTFLLSSVLLDCSILNLLVWLSILEGADR